MSATKLAIGGVLLGGALVVGLARWAADDPRPTETAAAMRPGEDGAASGLAAPAAPAAPGARSFGAAPRPALPPRLVPPSWVPPAPFEPPVPPEIVASMVLPDPADYVQPGLNVVVEPVAPTPREVPAGQRDELVGGLYDRMLATLDRDGDGRLSLSEIEGDPRVAALATALAGADRDGDGQISKDELLAASRRLAPPGE